MSQYPLMESVCAAFEAQFGAKPAFTSRAPGRINIIGEHTDYNDGFVLPAAIDRAVYVAGRLRSDKRVVLQSLDFHEVSSFDLDQLRDSTLPHWTRYPRGVLWMMRERGHTLQGMELTIAGDVPLGAGLSSSAAIEVAVVEMVCALLGVTMPQIDKALLGVAVENKFVGVPTGNMDQMISALGKENHALLIDCRSLEATTIPLPQGVTLLIMDTSKRRELTHSEYGKRRAECEDAARLLGVKSLRDVDAAMLNARLEAFPRTAPQIARRAMHVVYENARTLAVVEALKVQDMQLVGRLINEGHASLRDLFQISIPELDVMATLAQCESGCFGARMMGGGFGGAVIALVEDAHAEQISDSVAKRYRAATGLQATIYIAKVGAGSKAQVATQA